MSLVLLVDDDVDTLHMLSIVMKAAGHRARTAANGAEALVALRQEKFNAVVTDLAMPGIDGVELIERVRRDLETVHLPVIVLSGYLDERQAARLRTAGGCAVLEKPSPPDAIVRALTYVLSTCVGDCSCCPLPRGMRIFPAVAV